MYIIYGSNCSQPRANFHPVPAFLTFKKETCHTTKYNNNNNVIMVAVAWQSRKKSFFAVISLFFCCLTIPSFLFPFSALFYAHHYYDYVFLYFLDSFSVCFFVFWRGGGGECLWFSEYFFVSQLNPLLVVIPVIIKVAHFFVTYGLFLKVYFKTCLCMQVCLVKRKEF